jgi:hypothetical protein
LSQKFTLEFYSQHIISTISPRTEHKIHKGKISSVNLTDVIVALLHRVAVPRHCRRGRRGGQHHRCPTFALTPPASAPSKPRVLERNMSPSPDRSAYWPMEPSDHDTSPRGYHGHPCVIQGCDPCPNLVAPAVGSSSWGHEGEEEGEEDEEELRQISVVLGLL